MQDELGDWDWHIYTIDTLYKVDDQWEPPVEHREPYSELPGDLNGKEIQKRGDICTHATNSFFLKVKLLIAQLCPVLCDSVDCSRPGSSGPWNSLGKNTGVCSHFLLQGICLTQGLNLSLLHCRQILYLWATREAPYSLCCIVKTSMTL